MVTDFIYTPDNINNGINKKIAINKQTDYVDFIWQKYFNSKPSEFQLRYISRQQGKSRAILQVLVMIVNGLLPGNNIQYIMVRDRTSIKVYMGMIIDIINDAKEHKFNIDNRTETMIEFQSGGQLKFYVFSYRWDGDPFVDKNIVFMDW